MGLSWDTNAAERAARAESRARVRELRHWPVILLVALAVVVVFEVSRRLWRPALILAALGVGWLAFGR